MKNEACLQVAIRSRHQALTYLHKGKSDLAFAHFLVALTLCPNWKEVLKEQFISTLDEWCETLSSQQRYKDVFTCYEQAMELFPENPDILNSLGSHLYRWGHIKEAFNYFHLALTSDPLCLTARRNLQGTCNLLLERWHFRMLNDRVRNEAFQKAINKRISQMKKSTAPCVLDIGTGTGLLSLFAHDAGAKEAFACDYSETMINLATEVLESNNSAEGINLINKKSTELIIPTDVPERVALVVTEIVDAGIFGEGILQTLSDSWERLLKTEGTVIPQACTLWIAPIECDYIANKYQLQQTQREKVVFLDTQKLNLVTELEEPYDTEDLDAVPGGFRLLAEPVNAFKIDFCNQEEIHTWLKDDHKVKHKIHCSRSGKLQAMVAWFDLHLDEEITISSAPVDHGNARTQKAKCWDQAVFPEKYATLVTAETVLSVTISCSNSKLSVKTGIDNSCGDASMPSGESLLSTGAIKQTFQEIKVQEDGVNYSGHQMFCAPEERTKKLKLQLTEQVVKVSQEGIRFLNDSTWIRGLEEVAVHICEKVNFMEIKYVLDLSPLPLIGMFLLTHMGSSVQMLYTTNEEAVEEIASLNNINKAQLKCLSEEQVLVNIVTNKMKFDVIVAHLFDQTGELKEKVFTALPILRGSLSENGLFLPQNLSIVGQLIRSDWLAHVSHVQGTDSTCGYNIAPFINVYQSDHHLDLNVANLPVVKLGEPTQLLHLEPVSGGPISQDVTIRLLQSGEANALVYWFEIQYLPSCNSLSTFHHDSFVNQSAILFDPGIATLQGCDVKLHLKFEKGFFHIVPADDVRISS